MKVPQPKRKKIAIKVPPLHDGVNTPVPVPGPSVKLTETEAGLYKQADNPLGDPHKI
nr:hypothetical protein [uncultured Mucilaginibacter sp.]